MVKAYKDLSYVERDFRHIKVDDLGLRPIHHRLEARVRSHVFIAMLGAYLVWHLRQALASLTFTDEDPPERDNPVAPAIRSTGAVQKVARKHNASGEEVRGFRELLDHLDAQHRADDDGGVRDALNSDPASTPGLRAARYSGALTAHVASRFLQVHLFPLVGRGRLVRRE